MATKLPQQRGIWLMPIVTTNGAPYQIRLKTEELLTYHGGCHGDMDTIAM